MTAHSDKERAAPAWKNYGFHPLTVFADHGADGNGVPGKCLRPGSDKTFSKPYPPRPERSFS